MSKLYELAQALQNGELDHIHVDGERRDLEDGYYSISAGSVLEDLVWKSTPININGMRLSLAESGRDGDDYDVYAIIIKDEDTDEYIRITGYYSSWDGTSWEDGSVEEVEPQQVVVTRFVTKS